MAAGRPLTDDDRTRVKALHAQGKTRNEIARTIGRAQSTVSKLAAEQCLSFDRARTAEATKAKQTDAKALRAELSLHLVQDALRLRQQLWAPCKAFNFGGKDNTYAEVQLDEPTFRDKREIMQAVSLAAERHARLVELDADQGAEDAKAMLTGLAEALGHAWAAGQTGQ